MSLVVGVTAALADDKKKTEEAKVSKPKIATLAALPIGGSLPETAGGMSLFGVEGTDLRGMIGRINRAAEDAKVQGIVLQIRGLSIGRGRLNELREAIAKARKSGKKVYADLPSASSAGYLLACSCDRIIMPPSGTLTIAGVRAEVTFYKRLLEKVGVKADFIAMGKYKSAADSYTRDEMSGPFREQYEALLDDYFASMVETIAVDRKLDRKRVKELIDQGLFTAKAAKEAGLIDTIAYQDEFRETLRGKMNVDRVALAPNYGKKKVDNDFSGTAGMFKLMQLMMGGSPTASVSRGDKIAIVYAVGAITTGSSGSSMFGGQVMGSDTIVKALRTADKDKTVKAIVLRVDSPGGSSLASDLIWREIVRIKKPVVASMGDVAASGGYYISMGCDRIVAEPGTLTGSIGVIGGKLALGGVYDKLGVTTQVISRGKNSGVFSTNAPFTESERKAVRAMMQDIYDQFTSKAAKGRKMDVARLRELAQGRVWSGVRAKKHGLVDQLGTLQDAIDEAKKLAGLKPDAKLKLRILPKPKTLFDQLFAGGGIRVQHDLKNTISAAAPEFTRKVGDLEVLRRVFRQRVVLMLPYQVQIR